jgi:hypothetical protein
MSRVDQSILVNLLLFIEHGYGLLYVISHNMMTNKLSSANLCFMSSAAKRNIQYFCNVVGSKNSMLVESAQPHPICPKKSQPAPIIATSEINVGSTA